MTKAALLDITLGFPSGPRDGIQKSKSSTTGHIEDPDGHVRSPFATAKPSTGTFRGRACALGEEGEDDAMNCCEEADDALEYKIRGQTSRCS